MDPRHQQEAALFDAAMELPAAQRSAHLDQVCGNDAALRQRLEALLRASQSSCNFLDSPPDCVMTGSGDGMPSFEKVGDRIGRYKLLQQIGEGGCGVVYMAEQEEPVRRRVALKIIKLGMDTKSVIARFEAERQALALMDHPNIAKVLDAGATETGRPYFVMELVRGLRITEYCDEQKLSTRQRLELFIQVCQAIQHAHQKGIIHRDIKPSNILVSLDDGLLVPKVIDFGIAKATGDQRLTDKTIFTAFEQFIGTPAYMSPEQAVITNVDIDTRSDIYALGVLLYELLTGKTPFDAQELLAVGLDEMRRTIREQEPPPPSTRLRTLSNRELSTTAQSRGLDAPTLVSALHGDVDWIVMKCLEKDRARRYESANDLSADIQRHLKDEPVYACPPSHLYRVKKLARRHKLILLTGSVVAVAVCVGFTSSLWMLFREQAALKRAVAAERAQERLRQDAEAAKAQAQTGEKNARIEAVKSRQVAQFLRAMLQGVGPSVALGRDTTLLREILDKTAQSVGTELVDQPEVEVELRLIIAKAYRAIDEDDKARLMDEEALALAQSVFGMEHSAVGAALHGLALDNVFHGRRDEAEAKMRQGLAIRRRLFGESNAEVADSVYELSKIVRRTNQPGIPITLVVDTNRWAESEALSREALDIRGELLGNEHPDVAASHADLAALIVEFANYIPAFETKLPHAEEQIRKALGIQKRVFGSEHPDVAKSLYQLALILSREGKHSEANEAFRAQLELQRKLWGNDHPDTAGMCRIWMLFLVFAQDNLNVAEILFQEQVTLMHTNQNSFAKEAIREIQENLITQHKYERAQRFLDDLLSPGFLNQEQIIDVVLRARAELHAQRGSQHRSANVREGTSEISKSAK